MNTRYELIFIHVNVVYNIVSPRRNEAKLSFVGVAETKSGFFWLFAILASLLVSNKPWPLVGEW